ncbi:MAG: hypothetical protein ACLP1X_27980 [Polyangiaceae bacterium]
MSDLQASKRSTHPVFLSALLLGAWSIPWILWGCSTVVGGERYYFLADDPTISMRYGRNLARGLGLVWNAGERVEGYSNFLWTVYMGLVHLLPTSNAKMALPVLMTNVALSIVGMVFVYKIARRINQDKWFAALAVFAYGLNGDLFEWMIRGFETSLLATLVLAAFYHVLCDTEDRKPRLSTHLLIISLSLVRIDALLLSGLLMLWAILGGHDRRRALILSVTSLGLPALHFVCRWLYYGDFLPNTAYLKVFGWGGRLSSGLRWIARFYVAYPVAAILMTILLLRTRNTAMRVAAAIAFTITAYVTYVGGDIFLGFRFLAPVIPLVLLAALSAAWEFTHDEADRRLAAFVDGVFTRPVETVALLLGLATFGVAAFEWHAISVHSQVRGSLTSLAGALGLALAVFPAARIARRSPRFRRALAWGHVNSLRLALIALVLADTPIILWTHPVPEPVSISYVDNIHVGLYLQGHTPPGATVADTWAGLPPYFSERTSIDLLGKCDRHIAHMTAVSTGRTPGHNKFDYDYSLGVLRPDYVMAAFKLPVSDREMVAQSEGDAAFIGRLYLNDVFRRHCLPHPQPLEALRTLFACDWSSE